MNREINNIVDKVISEEIDKRINVIKNKIFEDRKMKKQVCSECGSKNMYENECMECGSMNQIMEGQMCSECGGGMMEGECVECGYNESEVYESKNSSKGQQYIAKQAKPYKKIGSNDFAKLRSKKSETKEGKKFPDLSGDGKVTRKDVLLGRGVKLNGRKSEKKESECMECGSNYMGESRRYRRNIWESAQEMEMELDSITPEKTGRLGRILEKLFNGKTQEEIEKYVMNKPPKWWSKFINWLKSVAPTGPDAVKKGGPVIGLAAIAAILIDTYKRRVKGFKEKDAVDEGVTYKITLDESTNETFYFKENEVINIIENIVLEEKKKKKSKTKTLNVTKSAQTRSKKENDDYINSVVKKMKDYLKGGSKGDYEMNPKHFPKGNGELARMSKMAYVPSGAVGEYIDNFTAAGLENLDYDEIHPNEKWIDDLTGGSSRTGNNPEWGNGVKTPVNQKRNKIRKDNLLAKIKRKAYNKSPQPILTDKSGEENDKTSKLMMKLESQNEKKIMSDIEKMKNLISYGKKTQ